jgi:hypothetical protein
MKYSLKISLFLLLSLALNPFSILAQDASSTPVPSIDEVTENLRERLRSSVSDPDAINQVESQLSLKGYVGTVTDIIQNTIVIEDKQGKKNVKVMDDSTILRTPGNSKIKLESVRINDSIIAIGDPVDDDDMDGKRLIVSENELNPPNKLSGLARVEKLNRYSFTLKETATDTELELFFTGSTAYKSSTDRLERSDIEIGDTILFTAVKDKDDDWSATIVMQVNSIEPVEVDNEL